MYSIEDKIFRKICSKKKSWAFSAVDFRDIASRDAVRQALVRLYKKGNIRRVMTGIYDYPSYSDILKQHISPAISKVAEAIARKCGWNIHPSSDTALNILGISAQVPGRAVYYSDGSHREYMIGKTKLAFRHQFKRDMMVKYPETALLVQAVKGLLPGDISDEYLLKMKSYFSDDELNNISKDFKGMSGSVYDNIKHILGDKLG